jgi:uncharacterized protein (TIGR00369 family)
MTPAAPTSAVTHSDAANGLSAEAINAFLEEIWPNRAANGGSLVEYADPMRVICRVRYTPSQLRPGGTLSGPTMMSLADTAVYALVFASVGLEPLAVTTNLSINFLRKPKPADLLAEARMLKRGRALLVADVVIRSDGEAEPCAHAVVTYSIPPPGSAARAT